MADGVFIRMSKKQKIIWDSLPKGQRSKIIKERGLRSTKPKKIKSYSNLNKK